MSDQDIELETPPEMAWWWSKIFDGEYDIITPTPVRVIVDIGGCVGAFAVWASKRWPEVEVMHVFEPRGDSFAMLERNTSKLPFVKLHKAAVGPSKNEGDILELHTPSNGNIGASSVYCRYDENDTIEEVECIGVCSVPQCDLLKLDCEGAELDIVHEICGDEICGRPMWPDEDRPTYIVIEYHSAEIRKDIQTIMFRCGTYELVGAEETAPNTGIQKWRKKSVTADDVVATNECGAV